MSSDEIEDALMTVAEVAELLRLNQQTVRNWIDAGTLPSVRVGRRVRIKRSDFNRILEDGYRAGPPAPAPPISGPSADDFWGGEPVGAVDIDRDAVPNAARVESSSGSANTGLVLPEALPKRFDGPLEPVIEDEE